MKRFEFKHPFPCFYILLICFSISCSYSVSSNQIESYSDDTVSFCELIERAEFFDSQKVKTSAVLLVGFESAFAYDPVCFNKNQLVWFEVKSESANKSLFPYLSTFSTNGTARVKAEITGKFYVKKQDGFGHLHEFNYILEITEVNNIVSISESTNLPF